MFPAGVVKINSHEIVLMQIANIVRIVINFVTVLPRIKVVYQFIRTRIGAHCLLGHVGSTPVAGGHGV